MRGARAPGGAPEADRRVASMLRGEPAELYAAARHLISSGGKRLRPYMALRSCQMLGGRRADAVPAAAAVEMIHNFTLVHDDIMDNDEVRHGVPTVHRKFGLPVAILAGDVLFSKAYQAVSGPRVPDRVAARLARLLSGACADVCEGQLMDISMARRRGMPTRAGYIAMVRKKTAALFGVSCAMGAVCAGAGPGDVARLASFGGSLGVAFQITDDLIGVTGDPAATGKPVGNDIREGKKSLPILMALGRARGRDRRAITSCLGNPRAARRDLERAAGVISGLGIEGAVRAAAAGYAARARGSISRYGGPARDDLAALLGFVVGRSL